jgi:hypothetical protein
VGKSLKKDYNKALYEFLIRV